MNKQILGSVMFKHSKSDITIVGDLISLEIFGERNKFDGLEKHLRDEIPFIYTENILGFYFGIMQSIEEKDTFILEIIDIDYDSKNEFIDLSSRLCKYISRNPEFKIISPN